MTDEGDDPRMMLDPTGWSPAELLERLAAISREQQRVRLPGSVRHGYLAGLNTTARITVDGDVGDYCLSMCQSGEVRIHGSAGAGLGDGMAGGSIRVRGSAGIGFGVAVQGGTLAVYGDAGDHCGAAMQGGEIVVRGDVGQGAGAFGQRGTLVIGGDAGAGLAAYAPDLAIYLRGHCPDLGKRLSAQPLSKSDQLKLGLALINAGIKGTPQGFQRILVVDPQPVGQLPVRGEGA
jgi:hypothetical protein